MDRLQRFEALTSIPEPAAVRLAERILDGSLGDFAVITPPTVGMVMARAQDDGLRWDVEARNHPRRSVHGHPVRPVDH